MEVPAPEIRNPRRPSDHRKVPFIEIAKWPALLRQNVFRDVTPLLHRYRRDTGQRPAVLLQISQVADHENLRMSWNRQIRRNQHATLTVQLGPRAFGKNLPEYRWAHPRRPQHSMGFQA